MSSSDDKYLSWVREDIRAIGGYHVQDAAGMVKLDAMENPFTWPEDMVGDWLGELSEVAVNRYPDPDSRELKARLREVLKVPAGAELLLGNGSDELIQMLAVAMAGPERVMLAPEPTFVMYGLLAGLAGMRYEAVSLGEDFSLDRPAMLAAIERHRPALTFLAYPNNPTGNLFSRGDIEAIIEASPGWVVVDEAYAAFADGSFLPDLARFPNLLVMRTLSKIGLAGLRLGILAGPPAVIAELNKVRLPYNINVLTQKTVDFALRNYRVLEAQTAEIRKLRTRLLASLAALPGVTAFASDANFILLRVEGAERVFAGLKEHKVLIKNLSPAGGLLRDCLRVTVGSKEQNQAFIEALENVLNK